MNLLFIVFAITALGSLMALGSFLLLLLLKHSWGKKIIKKDIIRSFTLGGVVVLLLFVFRQWFFPGTRIIYFYLGLIHFFSLAAIAYGFVVLLAKTFIPKFLVYRKNIARFFTAAAIFFIMLSSFNFFKPIAVEKYIIESEKISQPYTFVQITDIQYGTTTKKYMEKVIQKAMKQNPDFMVITGDLIDFDFYQASDFEIFNSVNVPMFFERGNHEFYHNPEKIIADLEIIKNMKFLFNQKSSFGEIDITGIDFTQSEQTYFDVLKNIVIDSDKYSILLYHDPKYVEESVAAGYDLLLYGHVHGGQIWPFTWLIDWMYQYSDGFYEIENAKAYVSDGAGLWGPLMRLDSQNEITVFELVPKG